MKQKNKGIHFVLMIALLSHSLCYAGITEILAGLSAGIVGTELLFRAARARLAIPAAPSLESEHLRNSASCDNIDEIVEEIVKKIDLKKENSLSEDRVLVMIQAQVKDQMEKHPLWSQKAIIEIINKEIQSIKQDHITTWAGLAVALRKQEEATKKEHEQQSSRINELADKVAALGADNKSKHEQAESSHNHAFATVIESLKEVKAGVVAAQKKQTDSVVQLRAQHDRELNGMTARAAQQSLQIAGLEGAVEAQRELVDIREHCHSTAIAQHNEKMMALLVAQRDTLIKDFEDRLMPLRELLTSFRPSIDYLVQREKAIKDQLDEIMRLRQESQQQNSVTFKELRAQHIEVQSQLRALQAQMTSYEKTMGENAGSIQAHADEIGILKNLVQRLEEKTAKLELARRQFEKHMNEQTGTNNSFDTRIGFVQTAHTALHENIQREQKEQNETIAALKQSVGGVNALVTKLQHITDLANAPGSKGCAHCVVQRLAATADFQTLQAMYAPLLERQRILTGPKQKLSKTPSSSRRGSVAGADDKLQAEVASACAAAAAAVNHSHSAASSPASTPSTVAKTFNYSASSAHSSPGAVSGFGTLKGPIAPPLQLACDNSVTSPIGTPVPSAAPAAASSSVLRPTSAPNASANVSSGATPASKSAALAEKKKAGEAQDNGSSHATGLRKHATRARVPYVSMRSSSSGSAKSSGKSRAFAVRTPGRPVVSVKHVSSNTPAQSPLKSPESA